MPTNRLILGSYDPMCVSVSCWCCLINWARGSIACEKMREDRRHPCLVQLVILKDDEKGYRSQFSFNPNYYMLRILTILIDHNLSSSSFKNPIYMDIKFLFITSSCSKGKGSFLKQVTSFIFIIRYIHVFC